MKIEIVYYIALLAGFSILPKILKRYGIPASVTVVVHTTGNSLAMPVQFELPFFDMHFVARLKARHLEE